MFGSILVKTYRIQQSYIMEVKQITKKLSSRKLYSLFSFILSFCILILLLWTFVDKPHLENFVTSDYREYVDCVASESHLLGMAIYAMIMFIGGYLAYSIRDVPAKFKEPIVIPIYSHIAIDVINEILVQFAHLPPNIMNTMSAIGIMVYSVATVFLLYIIRFKKIISGTYKKARDSIIQTIQTVIHTQTMTEMNSAAI